MDAPFHSQPRACTQCAARAQTRGACAIRGAGDDEWITEDWNFLNLFSSIILDFDDDEEGKKAEARVKARLGMERCRIVRYRYKDANAALKDGHPEVLSVG